MMLPEAMDLLMTAILLFLTFLTIFKLSSGKRPPIPPGPFAWPIVGNLFQLGKKPHSTLAKLAQVHGPLMSLRLGSQPLIVASSPAAAAEILRTHDSILSGRYVWKPVRIKGSKFHNLSLSMCDRCHDGWRSIKAIYRADLFSAKALESQAELRANKVMEMVNYLASKKGQVVDIKDIAFATSINILSNTILSMNFIDFEGNGVGEGMRNYIRNFSEAAVVPQLADIYPALGGWDFQGMYKKFMVILERMCSIWAKTVEEKRKAELDAAGGRDFADAMIAKKFSDEQINAMMQELFIAGTDTTSATIEWAFSELMKNQEVLHKLQDELRTIIGKDIVRESHLPQLVYLEACVKETLRLHPPGLLLLPRRAVETCGVMGYTIPKNSQIIVNVWALSRDPKYWEDPLSFKPERFLRSKLDYKGQDFEYLPFGSGRRLCPGQPMALKVVPLILASLVHTFDWILPNNMVPEMIDLTEVFDVTMQKEKPLCIIPMLRK